MKSACVVFSTAPLAGRSSYNGEVWVRDSPRAKSRSLAILWQDMQNVLFGESRKVVLFGTYDL